MTEVLERINAVIEAKQQATDRENILICDCLLSLVKILSCDEQSLIDVVQAEKEAFNEKHPVTFFNVTE